MECAVVSASRRNLRSVSFLVWSVACWFWASTRSRGSSKTMAITGTMLWVGWDAFLEAGGRKCRD